VCPPENVRAVFNRASFPLEALFPEPLVPHVGQFAVGKRVAAADEKFAIDEIAICRILPWLFFQRGHPSKTTHPVGKYRKTEGSQSQ